MTTFDFDQNVWYKWNPSGGTESMYGEGSVVNNGSSVFWDNINNSTDQLPFQQFQFYRTGISDRTYIIRNLGLGPNLYLAPQNLGTQQTKVGATALVMRTVDAVLDDNDLGVFWNITGTGDGTFILTNFANGTDWRMAMQSEGFTYMDNGSSTGDQHQFQFQQWPNGTINSKIFSTALMPTLSSTPSPTSIAAGDSAAGTPTTTPTTVASSGSGSGSGSGSSFASSNDPSSAQSGGGLSVGASAGIAVGIAVAVISGCLLMIFLIVRNRRKKEALNATGRGPGGPAMATADHISPVASAGHTEYYAGAAGYKASKDPMRLTEMDANQARELDSMSRGELDSSQHYRHELDATPRR